MSVFIRYRRTVMKTTQANDHPALALTRRSFMQGAAAMSLIASIPMLEADAKPADDTVFELRQYTLYGGRRDTLISLFEKNFIESQEAVGANIIGTFRDLDDPDRFVWIRGFRDIEARPQVLQDFYGSSPSWIAHKKEANATMVDSDNVLLLRPRSEEHTSDLQSQFH